MTLHIAIVMYTVVQILFVAEGDHWVATSYHRDESRLYVSKCSPKLHGCQQEQIVLIYNEAANGNTLTVKAIPVHSRLVGRIVDCFSLLLLTMLHWGKI